jgi:Tfp pilus assembly protein PilX
MRTRRNGAILAMALATLLVVTLMAGTILRGYLQAHRQLRREQDQLQAQWLAESALAKAAAQLGANREYRGETWKMELVRADGQIAAGSVTIAIDSESAESPILRISAVAHFPEDDSKRTRVERELIVKRAEPMTNDQ